MSEAFLRQLTTADPRVALVLRWLLLHRLGLDDDATTDDEYARLVELVDRQAGLSNFQVTALRLVGALDRLDAARHPVDVERGYDAVGSPTGVVTANLPTGPGGDLVRHVRADPDGTIHLPTGLTPSGVLPRAESLTRDDAQRLAAALRRLLELTTTPTPTPTPEDAT